jgi:hypothetical protein
MLLKGRPMTPTIRTMTLSTLVVAALALAFASGCGAGPEGPTEQTGTAEQGITSCPNDDVISCISLDDGKLVCDCCPAGTPDLTCSGKYGSSDFSCTCVAIVEPGGGCKGGCQ